jgi:thioredoxin reductase (NADPH)
MSQPDTGITPEVAIIGAGPIGIELAIAFQRAGVSTVHFEAGQIGQTFTWWPPNAEFFSTPERIALAGIPIPTTHQRRITGEEYLAYLRGVVEQFDLPIHTYEPVERVEPTGDGFRITTRHRTGARTYRARRVVLATGGMAEANRLGIPGEDLPHVSHYFGNPHKYFRQDLVIVGGRNSALEAALRCWRIGARVTISYRRPDFDRERVKVFLTQEVDTLIEHHKLDFLPATVPVEITPGEIILAPADENGRATDGPRIRRPADFVLLATGFTADMRLFEEAGVDLTGPECEPVFDPATMETNVPGLYVAGTAAGGTQYHFTLFIETSHKHVVRIVEDIAGVTPRIGSVESRNYALFTDEEKERPVSHK